MRRITLAFGCLLLGAPTSLADSLQGVASVIDGDTLEIHGQRIRLEGIDAPESRQLCQRDGKAWMCGHDSAWALDGKIGGKFVTCEGKGRDRYDRLLATCSVGNENLNKWLVMQGWAVAYVKYSTEYIAAQDEASAAHRGLWASTFQMPWAWRTDHHVGMKP